MKRTVVWVPAGAGKGWSNISIGIIGMLVMPIGFLLFNVFTPAGENWKHITEYLLKDYILNSLQIVLWTCTFAILIGVSLAWIVTAYEFPLRHFFRTAFILPLSIPAYIGAYTFNGLLGYTGAVQTFMRNKLGIIPDQKVFDIMTVRGAVFIFTLFLFPYVYLMTRTFLEKQSASVVESARLLGKGSVRIFLQVVLPISRVAIMGGASLVALEVINDYGVVKYFGIPTFSTAIFTTWFGMGDGDSALKLSAVLMLFVFAILLLEKILRGRRKYHFPTTRNRPLSKLNLSGLRAWMIFGYCFIVFCISFVIPVLQLLYWSYLSLNRFDGGKLFEMIGNSFFSAGVSAILIVAGTLILGNFTRLNRGTLGKILAGKASLGYAVPGAVIAMGVLALFLFLDKSLVAFLKPFGGHIAGGVLSGSLFMLVFAYFVRFFTIGNNSIEAGMEKLGLKFHEASRTMGFGITKTFFKVDLPMLRSAVTGAFILVFIDVLKELPLTLILRPFNFNTLSTRAFEYANDEMLHEAAMASLIIILMCLLSLFALNWINKLNKPKREGAGGVH